MGNVKEIKGGGNFAEPDQTTIDILKKLLEEARSGNITGIAYSCHADSGYVLNGHVGYGSYTMLAGLHMVAHSLTTKMSMLE